ncbi:MAG TPA: trypsin-like peptidase domain-containing protein [Terriglobia bacterium]|nr:trypsin-like peptidase domain-containing protein [Terriglobia bacterium]
MPTDREDSTVSVDATSSGGQEPRRRAGTDARGETSAWRDKILLLEGDMSSRHALEDIMMEAGYEVTSSGSCHDGLRLTREGRPDVLVLDERLAGFDCGDLLAAGVRAILLVSGAAPERVRALDLGADDVLSRPFEPIELQARVRLQLRFKRVEDELRDRLRIVEQSQPVSRTARVVTEKISRDAVWLTRGVKIGLALLVVLAALACIYYRFYQRASSDIRRNYADVAALSRNLANQQELIERARRLSEQMKTSGTGTSTAAQKQELEWHSRQLRVGLAQAQADSADDVRIELARTEARLQRLEDESSLAENIIKDYASSVCLIYVAVAFHDSATARPLRYASHPEGEPAQDMGEKPRLTLEGTGPEFRMSVLGAGFLVGKDGRILTNHHVVEPWCHDDDLNDFAKLGLQPAVVEMRAYFPRTPRAYSLSVVHIYSEADPAVVRGQVDALKRKVLVLDGSEPTSVRGESIVLMGYATGLDAVLARLDNSALQNIVTESDGDAREILDRLAEKNLIRPLVTQGHLGDVLPDQIVYDAQTAAGGSGGPVFNQEGKATG